MNREIREMTRHRALETLGSWREIGCEYASIVDGMPRPWRARSLAGIHSEARRRGVQVLSLANEADSASILEAMIAYVERSLALSRVIAEQRVLGAVVARGGTA